MVIARRNAVESPVLILFLPRVPPHIARAVLFPLIRKVPIVALINYRRKSNYTHLALVRKQGHRENNSNKFRGDTIWKETRHNT